MKHPFPGQNTQNNHEMGTADTQYWLVSSPNPGLLIVSYHGALDAHLIYFSSVTPEELWLGTGSNLIIVDQIEKVKK